MRSTDNVLMAVVFIICMMVMFFFLSILCDIIEDSVEGNVNAAIGYREIKKHPASEKDRGRERKPVRCGLHFGFPKQPEGHPERGEVSMKAYEGEVLLIVNTATGCGFTPQYETLEYLYKTYHKEGFTVIDFPCDQFGHQAPGSDDEIHHFCTSRYDISYPQFSKIEVNGKNEIPLYTFLKKRQGFRGFDTNTKVGLYLHNKLMEADPAYADNDDIKWNFTKFLVTREGKVIARFEPTDDLTAVEEAVKAALG